MPVTRWLFTCEHGGRQVPGEHRARLAGAPLDSHHAWDPGAREVLDALAARHADAAFVAIVTRLLVDLNRSLHNPRVWSEWTRGLPVAERERIAARWWRPWRADVARIVAGWLASGARTVHVSVHSFTPALGGRARAADIGLLYDPAHDGERALCAAWRRLLAERGWRVRLNYPYRGVADGHTTALRRRFGERYAGLELELNQALFPARRERLVADLSASLDSLQGGRAGKGAPVVCFGANSSEARGASE